MRCDMVMFDEFWQHMRHVVVYHIVLWLYCHFAPFLQIVWTTFKWCHGEIATWLHQPKQTKSEHKKTSIMNSYAESKSVNSCLAFPSSGCLLLTLHPLRVDGVFSAFSFLFIYLFIYLTVYTCYSPTDFICLFVAAWVSQLMRVSSQPPASCLCTFHLCHDSASGLSGFLNCLVPPEAEPLMIIEPFVPLLVHISFPWCSSFFFFFCLLCFVFRGDTLRWGVPSFFFYLIDVTKLWMQTSNAT